MSLTPESQLRPVAQVVAADLDEEVILLDLRSKQYYGLNETGARIWQLILEGSSVSAIAAALADEYDVSSEEAHAAVTELCSELLAADLITIVPSAEADAT